MLRSDKYISYEKLLDLAERALELHDAEYKIWQSKNNQPSYVDAIEDEPELFNESVRKVVKKNSSWWWPW
jgi:hypothetical protein